MKRYTVKNAMFCGAVLLVAVMFVACATQPNPLVGKWSDNRGDTITLMADNTFLSKITNQNGVSVDGEGTYSVMLNVITFTTKSGYQRVTEWDIRGNMLYITWTDDSGKSLPLTLYKVN